MDGSILLNISLKNLCGRVNIVEHFLKISSETRSTKPFNWTCDEKFSNMFSSKGGKGWTYLHDERETKPNLPVKMAADFEENAGRKHNFNCNFL